MITTATLTGESLFMRHVANEIMLSAHQRSTAAQVAGDRAAADRWHQVATQAAALTLDGGVLVELDARIRQAETADQETEAADQEAEAADRVLLPQP